MINKRGAIAASLFVAANIVLLSISLAFKLNGGRIWLIPIIVFAVTIWGKTAENLKPYLTKGKQIAVEGYLRQDRWEKDGQKFSKVGIVADSVMLLGGRSDNGRRSGRSKSIR